VRLLVACLGLIEWTTALIAGMAILLAMFWAYWPWSAEKSGSLGRCAVQVWAVLRGGTASPGCLTIPWVAAALVYWVGLAGAIVLMLVDHSTVLSIIGTLLIAGPPVVIVSCTGLWLVFYFWPPFKNDTTYG
jgi:hypothetical protein